jgi:hypothetical protein
VYAYFAHEHCLNSLNHAQSDEEVMEVRALARLVFIARFFFAGRLFFCRPAFFAGRLFLEETRLIYTIKTKYNHYLKHLYSEMLKNNIESELHQLTTIKNSLFFCILCDLFLKFFIATIIIILFLCILYFQFSYIIYAK